MKLIRKIMAFVEAEEARQKELKEARSSAEHDSFMLEFYGQD